MKRHIIIFMLSLLTFLVFSQIAEESSNPCKSKKTCGTCIVAGKDCAWCETLDYGKKNDQCDIFESLKSRGCNVGDIVFPEISDKFTSNKPVQDGTIPEEAVQLQPQAISLKIRPNQPYKFRLTFRQAENYPVDLYYLMDLSYSMKDDKAKLAELGNKIADSMSAITKNFRLGFGSFVDKVVMPYVGTMPERRISPCTGCVEPYSFQNKLSLSLNTSRFAESVRKTLVSGNLDGPEGGFDAMMQALVCEEDIGWRTQSRRMIVYSTDAEFHYAGDGKLGGVVQQNDGRCHLNGTGYYIMAEEQDYPSVSQMAAKVREKKVNVIFAVTTKKLEVYKKLTNYIEGSVAEELADDSSNIVHVVRENYKLITSKVKMKTENADNIEVKFHSKCLGNTMKETTECENLKIGQNVTFDVEILVKACPTELKRKRQFTIYPVGLDEKLTINLDLVCECDCEKAENEIINSDRCTSGNGTFECGMCSCYEGRYGKLCECGGKDVTSQQSYEACKETSSSSICSDRGECYCGACICNPRRKDSTQVFSGKYCECDDYSCRSYKKKICGGPTRGYCNCSKCFCETNYSGDDCGCKLTNDTCIAVNGKLCNGYGSCVCGTCSCDPKQHYRGPTCEDCPTCPSKCEENKDCVLCKAFGKEECPELCPNIELQDEVKETEKARLCQFKDEDDCFLYFTYEYDKSNNILIKAKREKDCPTPVNVLAIVLGVIGGIVAVGLALLLIWKLFTTIHDSREYAKFEKETENVKWDTGESPIYVAGTSTFSNPTYLGKK